MLVFDASAEPGTLVPLLEVFGFRIHRPATADKGLTLLKRLSVAAVFIDVAPRGEGEPDSLELCRLVKQFRSPVTGLAPPVMLLVVRDSAAGRVRAKLAGCDVVLTRPVSRGDAARALESCNVALPGDERHC